MSGDETEAEARALLVWLRVAVRDADTGEWEHRFCASMLARARRGPLRVSEKQLRVMRAIAAGLRERARDDGMLVERGT